MPAPTLGHLSIERVVSRADAESWYVRITTDAGAIEGRVLDRRTNDLTVADATLQFVDVVRVERRSNRGSGTIAGGLIGALVGPFVFALTGACIGSSCITAGVITGGPLGMILGKLLHPGEDVWMPVWQR
jgi:hypothetical protein